MAEDVGLDAGSLLSAFPTRPGLYLHVPFCERICPFCPYNKVLYRPERAARYFVALQGEVAAYLQAGAGPFTSLYVGGGTPTLCLDWLGQILASLPVDGERAIEVLPTHATPGVVARLVEMGFTHVSLGIQSFDDGVLRHLGRPHDSGVNRAALAAVVGRFACVDVDLIFDTAFDDPGTFLSDVEACCRWGVDQISTYPLMRFGYTPFGKAKHARTREHDLLHRAEEVAAGHGYRRSGVWSLRRAGSPAYTSVTREFYLGLGASAATFTGEWYLVSHFSPERYAEAVAAGRLPIARAGRLRPAAAAAYWLFWQAYGGRVDPALLRRRFPGARWVRPAAAALRALGWVRMEGGMAVATRRGLDRYHDLERRVTYRYIEPLWADLMGEHRAGPR